MPPSNDKRIVILDQNALSNLALWSHKLPQWKQCLDLLLEGVIGGTLFCPGSPETISESVSIRDPEQRLALRQTFHTLSDRRFLKFPWEILAETALERVRRNFSACPFRIVDFDPANSPEDDAFAEAKELEEALVEESINSVQVPRLPKTPFVANDWAYFWASDWLRLIRSNLNRLRNRDTIWERHFIVGQLFHTLIEHEISDQEIRLILADIRDEGWFEIPYFRCLAMLEGLSLYQTFRLGRKYKASSYWDFWRACAACHCGNIFVSEGPLISHMREVGLDETVDLTLVKVTEPDRLVALLST